MENMYRLKWLAPFGILGTIVGRIREEYLSRLTIAPFNKKGLVDKRHKEVHLWCPTWIFDEITAKEKEGHLMFFEVNPGSTLNDEPTISGIYVMNLTQEHFFPEKAYGMF